MRRQVAWLMVVTALFSSGSASASEPGADERYRLVAQLLSDSDRERAEAAEHLARVGDRSLVPALVDVVFFTPRQARGDLLRVLRTLTGQSYRGYYEWVEYVGEHGEIEPAPGYLEWKRELLGRIDEDYRRVLYSGAPSRIRLEEIVWGGVPMAGIPALDDPPVIAGSAARYLRKSEKVFGLALNGVARAYPLRILSWHELLNDRLGGEPVTLSFCTLCGSGIFYLTRTPNGGRYQFDTSGLLYRSNKLMVDRRSFTLWSNLTGEPVVGRLARSSARLEMLPGTLTTWRSWLERHPDTTVLDLRAIERQLGGRVRFDYRPGAADRARRGVSFPVWRQSDALEKDREVFALRLGDSAKAYPVDRVLAAEVVNDEVGGEPVVLVGDPGSGAIRAYRRSARRFGPADGELLIDDAGRRWRIDESGLRPLASDADGEILDRLPGHVAFWFGWYAFFPNTEVWPG